MRMCMYILPLSYQRYTEIRGFIWRYQVALVFREGHNPYGVDVHYNTSGLRQFTHVIVLVDIQLQCQPCGGEDGEDVSVTASAYMQDERNLFSNDNRVV